MNGKWVAVPDGVWAWWCYGCKGFVHTSEVCVATHSAGCGEDCTPRSVDRYRQELIDTATHKPDDELARLEDIVDKIRYAMDDEIERGYVLELLALFDPDSGRLIRAGKEEGK